MSKYCMKCGAKLNDDAAFCDECGAKQINFSNDTASKSNTGSHSDMNVEKQFSYIPKEIPKPQQHSGFGIVSFIFGIVSIITAGAFVIPEIIGLVFGYLGTRDASKKQGLGKAGMILSILSIVILLVILVFV